MVLIKSANLSVSFHLHHPDPCPITSAIEHNPCGERPPESLSLPATPHQPTHCILIPLKLHHSCHQQLVSSKVRSFGPPCHSCCVLVLSPRSVGLFHLTL